MTSLQSVGRTATRTIKLDITSDAICPFCFGLRKIQAAIAKVKETSPETSFSIQFHPFLLDPTLSTTPVNKRALYERKFGGKEKVAAMEVSMRARAKEVGIDLSYGGDCRQTHDAHRLLTLAYDKGGEDMQLALVNRFFEGYFEQEKDIGDETFLATNAVEAKLFPSIDEARTFLQSKSLFPEIQLAYKRAQSMGITGVPFTVIDSKYAVSGAQDIETFAEIFGKVAKGEDP